MESIDVREARRIALFAAGLLAPVAAGLPCRVPARGRRRDRAPHAIIERFGYLQLDSVAVTGARSHAIVLGSRLEGYGAAAAESLLVPGGALFEYWGHEASWIPLSLYPAFAFRRREYRLHPWWGDVLGEHRVLADRLMARLEREGPLRSLDLEGRPRHHGWGGRKLAQRVLGALWSAGEVAVRERRSFQRVFDLTERVIPRDLRAVSLDLESGIETLLARAVDGHGWGTTGTLAATWRLRRGTHDIDQALARMAEAGRIVPCLLRAGKRRVQGWTTSAMLERLPYLSRLRPRRGRGVLLSPFDPILWDRTRVERLFRFAHRLEIYKPAAERRYGYYCLPLLAGDRLVGRVEVRAARGVERLEVVSTHFEPWLTAREHRQAERALDHALGRFAAFTGLERGPGVG